MGRYSVEWRAFLLTGSLAFTAIAVWFLLEPSTRDFQAILCVPVLLFFAIFGACDVLLSRVILAENGIEKRNIFGKIQRWSYRDVENFEVRPDYVRVRFQSGSVLKVFGKMANPAIVTVYLKRYCPAVEGDPEVARWTVTRPSPVSQDTTTDHNPS